MNLKDNLDKLPKWAQNEVSVMQMRLSEAKEEIDRLTSNPVSNLFVGHETDIKDYRKPVYLDEYETITFRLPKGIIKARLEQESINIHTSGEGTLMVKPNVSNSVNLHLI